MVDWRKLSDQIDSLIQKVEEFPFNKMYDEMRQEAVKEQLGTLPSPARRNFKPDQLSKIQQLAITPLQRPRVKGPGYFGKLNRPEGGYSTEISIGVNNEEIPSLVPTLTKEEINYLLLGNKPTKDIIDKAVTHARLRKQQGKNPFAQRGELEWPVLK